MFLNQRKYKLKEKNICPDEHIMKYILLAMLFFSGNLCAQGLDLPDFYKTPPADTDQAIFAVATEKSLERAFALAMFDLASKLETKNSVLIDSYSDEAASVATSPGSESMSKSMVNQEILDFTVKGMVSNYMQFSDKGDVISEEFSIVTKLQFNPDDEIFYLIEMNSTESLAEGETEYLFDTAGSVSWKNASFSDVLVYLENSDYLNLTSEHRESEGLTEYFVLVELKLK